MKKIPDRGDIILCNFSPTSGHEQAGLRPAVILSASDLNSLTNMATVCPITSKVRGNFFEVPINNKKTKGVIMVYQITSIDFRSRKVKIVDKIDSNLLSEVIDKVKVLLYN
ncbi:MAG: type II toxin-antitoxin system PemK/MazF family toxin [Minisyncoccia bacterium]